MDGVIFEEFKGTGNMELVLDRELRIEEFTPLLTLLNLVLEKKNYYFQIKSFHECGFLERC
ncbi:MAG: hypothetical protein CM1200mP31_3170 [Candidatus Neomarinimicrobiota bacterium]|nr:MAG: hypothetical protein CM1200mP31_3170 [Candidatus Neomarinimicrobiota bacterium]